ncbi:sugar phosphate nucleotidyltransferase [Sulfoacidibacillus ferrooxidans]|uniref:Mannose-1-phosphate guanylyltransferase RfbM n=1 Tax=Sulfoacidibacillus ferrooxidans TaxID=2005001 RepID=A0A9X1V878_9BACL|nr:sugar phosphate nucleotidyltransferase [Sulfoacidibacillus ferrooxidans]MCI0183411.1 Mannose-1-phosphate guanylyltransferase RfbM [Sulfoacidibacillus ferrooxidans]
MKIILLSGGSGKRLWPMSNDIRSKQFLKVLQNKENRYESMLQRVWSQLGELDAHTNTFICASSSQMDAITFQIGNVRIVEEPERRDTFAAIALSSLYLLDIVGCDVNEPIVVLPVDHFVELDYFKQVMELPFILSESEANLVLMGVTPDHPASKFGYILTEGSNDCSHLGFNVKGFIEKPSKEFAIRLIESGALWNCGVFCFRLGYLVNHLSLKKLPTDYYSLRKTYSQIDKISFDYEVVEKENSIRAISYTGEWNDLGTWDSLAQRVGHSMIGLGSSNDCDRSMVINELNIPLVTFGLKDLVVVATPDGILVSNKAYSENLKSVIGEFTGRPMYEERRWGLYRVLDYQRLADGQAVLTKLVEMFPGSNISYQRHQLRSEVWTIIEGLGEVIRDDHVIQVSPGDVVRIYAEQWHGIRAITGLKLVEVQRGTELIEEDIERKFINWSELEIAIGLQT